MPRRPSFTSDRRPGERRRLGAFLDPVADKLLLTSAFITLTYLKVIPFWIAAVVVSRDLILSVGVLVIHVARVNAMKDHATFLAAMSTLPHVQGIMVGDGIMVSDGIMVGDTILLSDGLVMGDSIKLSEAWLSPTLI